MSTEHRKEKRKLRKQKKREQRQKEETERIDNERLDILDLLRTEQLDTKPNMMKFLERFVTSIRVNNCNNITVYPKFHYDISKVFIRFIDGTELYRLNSLTGYDYVLTYDFEDIPLTTKEKELLSQFFSFLFQFKVVY